MPGELTVADGVVSAGSSRVTYAELARDADLRREATAGVKPKSASAHRMIGKSVPRRDIPGKVTGKPSYVQDIRLPGMVYGRVVRPPSYRAQLVSCDEAAVRKMPGVVAVVCDGSFLAVAAAREEQAIKAAQALRASAKWRETADLPPGTPALFEHLQKVGSVDTVVNEKHGARRDRRPRDDGGVDIYAALPGARLDGASCAVAQMKDGKLTVWTHSQGVFPLRRDLARVMRMPEAAITAIHVEGAGCYGHNGADDVACDAALLARDLRAASEAAVDARGRVRLGAVRLGDGDEAQSAARRARTHRRLAARRVEPSAQHAPRARAQAATCLRAGTSPIR